jgi:DNA (cytosine-5)-methyltransferase 1
MLREIIVDSFAGGGGASTGIALAIGRSVDIAINHDPEAIAMHKVNHPDTEHYCESVWEVDPRKATNGRPVALCWFSPDCKHFSKAKGGKPVEKHIRGLAWIAVRWAATVRPRVIMLENVEEFKTWGPLLKNGMPDPDKKGRTFNAFINALKRQGYQVQHRELRACDYGAPTIRKRFFLIARCDGQPIVWPRPTHGDPNSEGVNLGRLKPWKTAAEIIDWSRPCPSIFDTKEEIKTKYGTKTVRPLAENTIRRVAKGTQKFVIENPNPFIIRVNYSGSNYHYCNSINEPLSTITSKNGWGIVTPFLSQYHSYESDGARGQTIDRPILTIDTNPRYALTAAFVSKYYGTGKGSELKEPLHTVTTKDRNALIEAHLCILRNHMDCKDLREPLSTVTTSPGHFAEVKTVLTRITSNQDLGHWPEARELLNKYCGHSIANDEILLLKINGDLYFISDIGMRMLEPRELFNAQGFPANYIIDHDSEGNKLSKATQVARCGNAVPPPFADHLTRSNLPELCGEIPVSEAITK